MTDQEPNKYYTFLKCVILTRCFPQRYTCWFESLRSLEHFLFSCRRETNLKYRCGDFKTLKTRNRQIYKMWPHNQMLPAWDSQQKSSKLTKLVRYIYYKCDPNTGGKSLSSSFKTGVKKRWTYKDKTKQTQAD